MKRRNLGSSVMWSLKPLVCVLRFLGHGLLWLALSGIKKMFQIKYKTGYASLVLLERSQLRSSLMCASFFVFRMKGAWAALRHKRDTTDKGRSSVQAPSRTQ